MNKRQKKKNNSVKQKETRALIKVDLKNATSGKHVDVYVSNRFEAKHDNEQRVGAVGESKEISVSKVMAKGKDCVLFVVNVFDKKLSITMRLSETDKSYYVIRDTENK